MNRTRKKLQEAAFFLRKLEEARLGVPVDPADIFVFDYYLSAFICSGRSVLWVMRNDYHDVEGWESWYASKEPTPCEELLLRKINDIRVRAEKRAPLDTRLGLSLTFTVHKDNVTQQLEQWLDKHTGATGCVTLSDEACAGTETTDNYARFPAKLENISIQSRKLQDFPDEDVVEVCKTYYSLIERMVAECEARFGTLT